MCIASAPGQLRRAAAQLDERAELVRGRVRVALHEPAVDGDEARRREDDDVLAELWPPSSTRSLSSVADGVGAVRVDDVEHLLREREELVVLRDRLGLAADGDHRAARPSSATRVADLALRRLAAGALARLGHPALAQQPLRGLDVAAGLLERALAVHHPGAGQRRGAP